MVQLCHFSALVETQHFGPAGNGLASEPSGKGNEEGPIEARVLDWIPACAGMTTGWGGKGQTLHKAGSSTGWGGKGQTLYETA